MFTHLKYGVALAVLAHVSSAHAQPAGNVEEIVVTARKTTERLQDIPLTVTAFTEERLEAAGIDNMQDLQSFTPGLNFFGGLDRSYGNIFFRGMSSVPPVGDTTRELASLFIDGVYYVGIANVINFDDIERVEVVKGPQSAFFGRATFSGAINFISKTPGDEFKARVRAKAATGDEYEVGLSAEGPLIPGKLSGRLSGTWRDFGGQYTNAIDGQKLGAEEDRSAAAILYATPSDNFSAKVRFMYQNSDDGPAASILIKRLPEHNCGPFGGTNRGAAATLFCGAAKYTGDPDALRLNSSLFGPALQRFPNEFGTRRDFKFVSLNIDYEFADGWSFSALGGHAREHQRKLQDFERTGEDVYQSYTTRDQTEFSQEVRLATPTDWRLRGLVGLFYLWQDNEQHGFFINGSQYPIAAQRGVVGPDGPSLKIIENQAVFGAVSYDILDNLTFSVEGRYQKDDITAKLTAAQATLSSSDLLSTTKSFLPRFILDYKPQPNTTIYANVAKGNRPTQANFETSLLPPDRQRIVREQFQVEVTAPEETIWNYELGIKTEVWDGRGLVNAAVFYADRKGKQGTKGVQFDFNGNGVIETALRGPTAENLNAQVYPAGNQRVYGFELEANAALSESLQVGAAVAYAHGKYYGKLEDDLYFRYFGTLNAVNQKEPLVSEWSGNATLSYTAPLAGDLNWFARVDEVFIGSRYTDILNKSRTGDSWKTNVKLGIETDRYTVTLFVDNLFQDRTAASLRYQSDSATDPFLFRLAALEALLPRRRQFGITGSYNF